MPVRLIESLATTSPLAQIFSDASLLQAMLNFEAALARAEARAGVIPQPAADAITRFASVENLPYADLAAQGLRAGTVSIPLVKALTDRIRAIDPEAAGFVHWGATSQDVSDTAMVLLLGRAGKVLSADHERIAAALRRLSDQHAGTVMLGKTLMQPAPPVTFGLKVAGWYGMLHRSWTHLERAFDEAGVVQFGGASGTLAAIFEHGAAVSQALADELGLRNPPAPWHTHRDRLAALLCACGVYAGCLAKMGKDVILLMQGEVAEAFEPGGDGRGGSSTMPHKRNPVACSVAVGAAGRVPGLVANFLFGMAQEHERAAGGWQAESATISEIVQAAGLALASMVEVAEGLTVDRERMRANIDATRGAVFAEREMMLLAPTMGRDAAHKLVNEKFQRGELEPIQNPEDYLGSAEFFRKRLLES